MLVSEVLLLVTGNESYVANSLKLKSSDALGCVYVWLEKPERLDYAVRGEMFIATTTVEDDVTTRTVTTYTRVHPAN